MAGGKTVCKLEQKAGNNRKLNSTLTLNLKPKSCNRLCHEGFNRALDVRSTGLSTGRISCDILRSGKPRTRTDGVRLETAVEVLLHDLGSKFKVQTECGKP